MKPGVSAPRIIAICFLAIFLWLAATSAVERDAATVKKIIDGDTIILRLRNGEEKARLIGVDTPEKNHPLRPVEYFSNEASEFLRKLCEGKKVLIEYEGEKRDKYGRLLVYLFLEDGRDVSAEIIRQGYGFAYTRYPFHRQEEYREYEAEARRLERGLWKSDGMDELKWLISTGSEPLHIYEMAGKKWAIVCEGYAKVRLSEKELLAELNVLRIWTGEFRDDELKRTLAENGWMPLEK